MVREVSKVHHSSRSGKSEKRAFRAQQKRRKCRDVVSKMNEEKRRKVDAKKSTAKRTGFATS